MSTSDREPPRFDRRWFLAAGGVVALAAACGNAATTAGTDGASGSSSSEPPSAPAGGTGGPATAGPSSSGATSSSSSSGPSSSSTSTGKKGDASTSTQPTTKTTAAGPAPFFVHAPGSTDRVALTFHTNGDLTQVKAVLDIVEKKGAVLTAFIVGNWLDANPSMGKRLMEGHHELANHTYTHPSFEQLSPAAMATEITRCRDAIAKVSGSGGRYFRLSGTDDGMVTPSTKALTAAAAAGYAGVAGFDVDPFDYKDPGAQAVIDRTLQKVAGGSIISLHMGHAGTIDAIGPILDGLASKKLTPVTLSTLMG